MKVLFDDMISLFISLFSFKLLFIILLTNALKKISEASIYHSTALTHIFSLHFCSIRSGIPHYINVCFAS
jgi:hypothetical protein